MAIREEEVVTAKLSAFHSHLQSGAVKKPEPDCLSFEILSQGTLSNGGKGKSEGTSSTTNSKMIISSEYEKELQIRVDELEAQLLICQD